MKDIIKKVKYLEQSSLFNKGVSQTMESEVKEQKGGFLVMLMATLKTNLQQGKIFNAANFEVQKYNQKEPRVNSAYLRKHLPKIKDGACVISIKQ